MHETAFVIRKRKKKREKRREDKSGRGREKKPWIERIPRGRNVGISGLTIFVKVAHIVFLRIGKPVLVPLLSLENDERASPTRFPYSIPTFLDKRSFRR